MYKDRAAYFGLAERVSEGCELGQTGRKIDVCARGEKHK